VAALTTRDGLRMGRKDVEWIMVPVPSVPALLHECWLRILFGEIHRRSFRNQLTRLGF